jgi:hypothetical protein
MTNETQKIECSVNVEIPFIEIIIFENNHIFCHFEDNFNIFQNSCNSDGRYICFFVDNRFFEYAMIQYFEIESRHVEDKFYVQYKDNIYIVKLIFAIHAIIIYRQFAFVKRLSYFRRKND